MTRINANIDPADLCDQHLIAEYREIVRIPNFVLGGIFRKQPKIKYNQIPEFYKLGPGHVKFFYNKIKFLHNRFLSIKKEMSHRKIKNEMTDSSFLEVKEYRPELYCDVNLNYGNKIVVERIIERINSMKKATYCKTKISKVSYCQILKNKYGNS